jgi:putative aminophosphonate oxidoreductase
MSLTSPSSALITRRSHWLGEALTDDTAPPTPLDGDTKADVCIVGGGFTGLWTAIRLKELEPSLDVVVIEKDLCGSGASGRNGGFVLSWWAKFQTLEKICGGEEAVRLAKVSADAVQAVGAFCDAEGIDAHYKYDGWLWAATSESQRDSWEGTLDSIGKYQIRPFEHWEDGEVASRSGSPTHLAGVFEPTAASVQPALLARGLRRVALERGVRLHENTPLERLQRDGAPKVVTPRGTVSAKKVVLAMNAWGIRFAEIRKAIIVVTSDIVATAPAPDRLAAIGWDNGMTISDSRMLVHYYRTTKDGRVVFGKGGMNGLLPFGGNVGPAFDGPSRIRDDVAEWFRWTYPALKDVPVETSWTGPIDRSKSGLPFFGPIDERGDVLTGVGYSGNGVGPCHTGGRILASLALDRRDEWSECGLVRPLTRDFPREPIRYIGGQLVRRAVARKDSAADRGETTGPLTEYLASFAPAGLSPFKGQKAGLSDDG